MGNGLRMQTERLTRSVRRVAGRHGPLARPAGLPARLSGEGRTGGKRSPHAKRAPRPFLPAGRRTVRAKWFVPTMVVNAR